MAPSRRSASFDATVRENTRTNAAPSEPIAPALSRRPQALVNETIVETLRGFSDAIAQALESSRTPVPTPAPQSALRSLRWEGLDEFSTAEPAKIDRWFSQFEGKLKGANVPERDYLPQWHSCPRVDQKYKEDMAELAEVTNYATLRQHYLTNFGPFLPTEFYRQEMHKAKFDNPSDAVEELTKLRMLHNRAARDAGMVEVTDKQLYYYFIASLPKNYRTYLESKLPDSRRQENCFKYICDAAASVSLGVPTLNMVEQTEHDSLEPTENLCVFRRTGAARPTFAKPQFTPKPSIGVKRPAGQGCQRCGKQDCDGGERCFAQGKTCHFCKMRGHLSTVCRKKSRTAGPSRPFGGNPNQEPVPRQAPFYTLKDKDLIEVTFKVGGRSFKALADSGASLSLCSARVAGLEEIAGTKAAKVKTVRLGDGSSKDLTSVVQMSFTTDQGGTKLVDGDFEFWVLDTLPVDVILGLDFMRKFKLNINPGKHRLEVCDSLTAFLPPDLAAVRMGDDLTEEERTKLSALLADYTDIFANDAQPYGRTSLTHLTIDTGSSPPISHGLRPTSPQDRQIIREEVDKMLSTGVIRPSMSPWASPVVLVPKPDGSTRFCVDYRRVNSVTKKDVYPLPRVTDMLEALARGRYFTTMDAASGYWQIPMAPKDIEKTAFLTPEGLYEFTVMPFGLCNAPAVFQRLMNGVLAGLLWVNCLVYLDDVNLFTSTFDEHLEKLRDVFERFRQAGLKLKAKKCVFGASKLKFLGHVVAREGVMPDPEKVTKLRNYPEPRSVNEVRQFLGLAGYYRRFIERYSARAGPLLDLLVDGVKFAFDEKQKQAFTDIKTAIESEAVLPHPRFDLPFILDTDASDEGLGAVLSQVVDDKERPICFASRRLLPAEKKWHIREKEALGIIWGLETFRHFLLGSEFLIRTDHSSLTDLAKAKSGRLARWAIRLAEFGDFQVQHRAGRQHGNCDALSRALPPSDMMPEIATYFSITQKEVTESFGVPRFRLEEIRERQLEDPWIIDHRIEFAKGQRPGFREVDGILCAQGKAGLKILVPEALRETIVQDLHDFCHFGRAKILSLVQERYHWPGIANDVKRVCSTCLGCLKRKTPQQKSGLLGTRPPTAPWDTVAMDFCGPYVKSRLGHKYVLVFVDEFTKWVELCPCTDQLASTVARKFIERIIAGHGLPSRLLSDRGPQFKSGLIDSLCGTFGIRKIFSSAYYPQGDGYAERFMRTMNNSLSVLCRSEHDRWDEFVPTLQLAYNASGHAATGFSPFQMNTGRIPRLPGESEKPTQSITTPTHFEKIRDLVGDTLAQARSNLESYWSRMKASYDRGRKEVELKVGDWVLIRLNDHERSHFPSLKLAERWSDPCKIVGVKSNNLTYDVQRTNGVEAVHVSRLLPLSEAQGKFWEEQMGAVPVPGTERGPSDSADGSEEDLVTDDYVWYEHPRPKEDVVECLEQSPYVDISPSPTHRHGDLRWEQSYSAEDKISPLPVRRVRFAEDVV